MKSIPNDRNETRDISFYKLTADKNKRNDYYSD
jgi:hypothetical protein